MTSDRMEAFTDGVIAVAITIMVLEMKPPAGTDLRALAGSAPVFLAYVLSYVNIGIFWNNHHHVMQASERVDGRVLWANLFFLFWLTLIPFVLHWINERGIAPLPIAVYGIVLFMIGVGYIALQRGLIAVNGADSHLAEAIGGGDWKARLSLLGYPAAVGLDFISAWISIAIYVVIALAWFVPDRRIETQLKA